MQSNVEFFYDLIFKPRQAFQALEIKQRWLISIFTLLLSISLPFGTISYYLHGKENYLLIHFLFFVQCLGSLFLWICGTAFYHLVAELIGGRGQIRQLLSALAFAHVPQLAIIPLWVLSFLLSPAMQSLWIFSSVLLTYAWMLSLYVLAISEIYGISTTETLIVLAAPFLLIALCGIGMAVFVAVMASDLPLLWIF